MTATVAETTAPAAVTDLVEALLSDADWIEFPDHGRHALADDWTTLNVMSDPEQAGNNCHAATWAISEHVVEQIGQEPDTDLRCAEAVYSEGVHWFPVIETPTGSWAVDFTARQFDPAMPFPTVAPLNSHLTWLDARLADTYNDTRQEFTLH